MEKSSGYRNGKESKAVWKKNSEQGWKARTILLTDSWWKQSRSLQTQMLKNIPTFNEKCSQRRTPKNHGKIKAKEQRKTKMNLM